MRAVILLSLCIVLATISAFQLRTVRIKAESAQLVKLRLIKSLKASNSEFERTTSPKEDSIEKSDIAPEPTEESAAEVKRKEISDNMKQKLRQELISQGADPNYSAGPVLGNPILLISFVIGILVLIGGKGYFF